MAQARRRGLVALGLVVVVGALGLVSLDRSQVQASQPRRASVPALASRVGGDVQFAYVGANFNQVLAFDPRTQSFTVDLYLWLHWRGGPDLTNSIELVNVKGSEHIFTPAYPRAKVLPDGERYQSWDVQADFVAPMDFSDYPRDIQTLVVRIEDSAHDIGSLVLLPERVTSGQEFTAIPAGYVLARPPTEGVAVEHEYPTSFGLAGATASTYSQVVLSFEVSRPIRSYLGKSFLPIAIVVLIALMAYLLGPARVDSRVALAVTAMISAVLLHMDAVRDVPPTPNFLRVDWIFLTAYVVILLVLVESIISVHLEDGGRAQLARRLDLGAALLSVAIFALGVLTALM